MQRATCARCGRKRYTDRMRSVPGRVVGESELWVCVARSSCKTARKARRHLPALEQQSPEVAVVPILALRALIEATDEDLELLIADRAAGGDAKEWRAARSDLIRALGVPDHGDLE